MFAFNDSPFSGKLNDPLRLKHASAVRTPLPELFTGDPESVYRFRKDATMRITNNGLKTAFNIRIRQYAKPDDVTQLVWDSVAMVPARYAVRNILDDHAGITMEMVVNERNRILNEVRALTAMPEENSHGGIALADKQHRNWLGEFINSSCSTTVRQVLEAHEEDHNNDGVVSYFCLLQEYSGATRESIMLAEAHLHPDKIKLDRFDHNVKHMTSYVREHVRTIMGSGGRTSDGLFINLHTALAESHSEPFRLQGVRMGRELGK